ncbi:MAG: MBOAT family protein [Ruminococcaceae bacterium]|nr:MBOAT family protein [Oscillospiraceae bacterium]
MVFSTPLFLFGYLPLALVLYYLVPFKLRNGALFALSLLFYGWEEPIYILIMLFSVTVAYLTGYPIGKYCETDKPRARRWLILSIGLNLIWLLFFKYTNFFIENLALIPGLSSIFKPIEGLTLPVGISFYTFQIMSYSIDLYRGHTETQKNYVAFGTYVALFPQLIAGPIVRYRDVNDQLTEREHTMDKFASGVHRFTVGFAKKLLLGDAFAALYAYLGTSGEFEPSVLGAWVMMAAYTLHIYFDFSGYSDMAIGLGRLIGFEFLENFNYPYLASSITDFWRRWHMSLSSWFREYVYIPLGGNRKGLGRQIFNMAVVWLLTGFWHGAAWNFVLWGIFYFILLVLEKTVLLKFFGQNKVTAALGHIWALVLVGIGWMIFDHTDLSEVWVILQSLVGVGTVAIAPAAVGYEVLRALPLLLIGVIAATPLPARLWGKIKKKWAGLTLLEPVLMILVLILSIAAMVSGTYSPFLYFNF